MKKIREFAGVNVNDIGKFMEENAGQKVPLSIGGKPKFKFPKMKFKEKKEEFIKAQNWSFRAMVVMTENGCRVETELKWIMWFWLSLVGGLFAWQLLISAFLILVFRFTRAPKYVNDYCNAIATGQGQENQ